MLLDAAGLSALGEADGSARVLDLLRGRGDNPRAKAEGRAVDLSIGGWSNVPRGAALSRILGPAPRYLSVGHSGLDARCLGAMAALPDSRAGVFLHDTIPLDLPHTQRAGTPGRFADKLGWVARSADFVFAPLEATAAAIEPHLARLGWRGEMVLAPPGVEVSAPCQLPEHLPMDRPYFVALGTIEPRKNIGFLLDVWDQLAAPKPRLFVVGRRGWNNADVFAALDRMALSGDVIECGDLDDGAVSALLSGAQALLFPSQAEGFGYPPVEAALLGAPVVSQPLPQTKELLGDSIIYACVNEMYLWVQAIEELTVKEREPPRVGDVPKWFVHFDIVLKSLG